MIEYHDLNRKVLVSRKAALDAFLDSTKNKVNEQYITNMFYDAINGRNIVLEFSNIQIKNVDLYIKKKK